MAGNYELEQTSWRSILANKSRELSNISMLADIILKQDLRNDTSEWKQAISKAFVMRNFNLFGKDVYTVLDNFTDVDTLLSTEYESLYFNIKGRLNAQIKQFNSSVDNLTKAANGSHRPNDNMNEDIWKSSLSIIDSFKRFLVSLKSLENVSTDSTVVKNLKEINSEIMNVFFMWKVTGYVAEMKTTETVAADSNEKAVQRNNTVPHKKDKNSSNKPKDKTKKTDGVISEKSSAEVPSEKVSVESNHKKNKKTENKESEGSSMKDDKNTKKGGNLPKKESEGSSMKDDKNTKKGGNLPKKEIEGSSMKDDKNTKKGGNLPKKESEGSSMKDDKNTKNGGNLPKKANEGSSMKDDKNTKKGGNLPKKESEGFTDKDIAKLRKKEMELLKHLNDVLENNNEKAKQTNDKDSTTKMNNEPKKSKFFDEMATFNCDKCNAKIPLRNNDIEYSIYIHEKTHTHGKHAPQQLRQDNDVFTKNILIPKVNDKDINTNVSQKKDNIQKVKLASLTIKEESVKKVSPESLFTPKCIKMEDIEKQIGMESAFYEIAGPDRTTIKCNLCDCNVGDLKNLKAHSQFETHKNNYMAGMKRICSNKKEAIISDNNSSKLEKVSDKESLEKWKELTTFLGGQSIHFEEVDATNYKLLCRLCNCEISGMDNTVSHMKGKSHLKKLSNLTTNE